jgi:hypothetical protein
MLLMQWSRRWVAAVTLADGAVLGKRGAGKNRGIATPGSFYKTTEMLA